MKKEKNLTTKALERELIEKIVLESDALNDKAPGSIDYFRACKSIETLVDALTKIKKEKSEARVARFQAIVTAALGVGTLGTQAYFLVKGFEFEETGHITSDTFSTVIRNTFNRRT